MVGYMWREFICCVECINKIGYLLNGGLMVDSPAAISGASCGAIFNSVEKTKNDLQ